tara:strand:- start:255 stop:689 length:435 start_codon:yes stop_codon:yes gene_type:complete
MTEFSGSCLCGAIIYEVYGEVLNMWNCHCIHCRKITGAAFATNIFINVNEMKVIKGVPSTFQNKSDSGNTMTRYFCCDCGSPLFNENSARPGIRVIRIGTIEDANFAKPWCDLFISKALPYTPLDQDLVKFERMPPTGAFGTKN